jgi:hypothetical protein
MILRIIGASKEWLWDCLCNRKGKRHHAQGRLQVVRLHMYNILRFNAIAYEDLTFQWEQQ